MRVPSGSHVSLFVVASTILTIGFAWTTGWFAGPSMSVARDGAAAVAQADGRLLVSGGAGSGVVAATSEALDATGTFVPAAPMLANHARVLAVDLLGFGRTPGAGRGYVLCAQHDMLERFLAEIHGTPSVVVGYSMVGTVALQLAAKAPDLVAGSVLV